MTTSGDSVQHRAQGGGGAFFVERDGASIAELTYAREGDVAVVDHTWVDPAHRGSSLARDLAEAAVGWARGEGLKIRPVCSYMQRVLAKPGYEDVRA